jgi:hypothetical protein
VVREEVKDDRDRRLDQGHRGFGSALGLWAVTERLIEVKTTALGKCHPFIVPAIEVRCSENVPDRFQLFQPQTPHDGVADPVSKRRSGHLALSCYRRRLRRRISAHPER